MDQRSLRVVTGERIRVIRKALSQSRFRARFHLNHDDIAYIQSKNLKVIRSHAFDFITKRLAPASPVQDGKQTPFRGHPVFKAQHATATCCRGCLQKWYRIPKRQILKPHEIELVVDMVMYWIQTEFGKHALVR